MFKRKASGGMAFPKESYRRFYMKLHISRAGMYVLSLAMGYISRYLGIVEFSDRHVALGIGLGLVTTPVFYLLYKNRFEDRTGIWLYPYWAVLDVVCMSIAMWATHDPSNHFYMLYILSAGSAAFVSGGRAAFIMGVLDVIAYSLVLILMDTPMGLWERFQAGMLPLLLMFGISAYFLRGVGLLRNKRLEVMHLSDEKSRNLIDMEARTLELETANRRVELANKAKTSFLANMSHELRTPLNSIIGFSDFLLPRVDGRLEEKEIKFLNNIHVSGKHLLGLINDILDLSKVEAGQMDLHLEEVDLKDVVESVCAVMGGMALKREIPLEVDIASDVPTILSDGPRVKQILYNLVSNAVKFSEDGSKVVIRVRTVDAPTGKIGVRGVKIDVQDFGIGLKEEDQERIFQEFAQVDDGIARNFQGTGLGLALVRRFCGLLGGRIDLQSEFGQGSTFSVVLPLDAAVAKEIIRGLPVQ